MAKDYVCSSYQTADCVRLFRGTQCRTICTNFRLERKNKMIIKTSDTWGLKRGGTTTPPLEICDQCSRKGYLLMNLRTRNNRINS